MTRSDQGSGQRFFFARGAPPNSVRVVLCSKKPGASDPRLLQPYDLFNRRPYEQGAPISKNVRDTSGRDAVTTLVVSVRTTSVYAAQAKTNV